MWWKTNLRRELGMIRARFRHPVITKPSGDLALGAAPLTFVSVVSPTYNQNRLDAVSTARQGWCHAFEQLGIPYIIVSAQELAAKLPAIPNPICLVQNLEYLYMSRADLAALKRTRHFVWVDYWFKDDIATLHRHNMDYQSLAARTSRALLSAEPAFIFTISPESSLDYYSNWAERGLRLFSIPLACDTTVYRRDTPTVPAFAGVQLAFVGGYWPFKAVQFDRYLRPYEDKLTVYGRAAWPYAGYGGKLPIDQEAALYRQAVLAPTINEPHCEIFNIDLNERVFKVLGSGGCSLTDACRGYRDWFSKDELAVPASLAEFHDFVHLLLTDETTNQRYRERGYQAVLNRHTYLHRAQRVLELLGVTAPQATTPL